MHIQSIDHVALKVRDVELSARWYAEVLGFQRRLQDRIGDVPALMYCGKTALNLFPVGDSNIQPVSDQGQTSVMHIAFTVDQQSLQAYRKRFDAEGIPYRFVDREVCWSLYLNDPDGNQLELTYWQVEV